MNVLLINPETPPTFWSFPEQILFSGRKALVPPLGLMTVAALLPKHWNLTLVDLDTRKVEEAEWNWANIVMLSGMIAQRQSLINLVKEAKKREKTVIVGGPYVSSVPDEVKAAGCDFIVRGEAEDVIQTLIHDLESGRKSGIIEAQSKPDITGSPIPRFDLINFDDYLALTIQTSRGCPFDCEFCDIVNLYGRKPRCKTPEQVIRELEHIYRLGWRREVFISDDNFVGNRSHAVSVLSQLTPWMKRHGEPFNFIVQASVNLGQDIELIDMMTEANFANVFVGVESPDEDVLAASHKYQNIRNPLMESLNNINKNGLSVLASFIIGFDGEQKGAGSRIASFVEQTSIPVVMLNTMQVLPNTKLWNRLRSEGRLIEDSTSGLSTGASLNFVPTRPEEEILQEYVQAWDYLYEPSRFLARNYRYYLSMRPTRAALGMPESFVEPDSPKKNPRLSDRLGDVFRFARLCVRQGLLYSCRRQYWRQIFGILKHNPSRFVPYVARAVMGEDMFRIRKALLKDPRAYQRQC